jgi:hypothetical protein
MVGTIFLSTLLIRVRRRDQLQLRESSYTGDIVVGRKPTTYKSDSHRSPGVNRIYRTSHVTAKELLGYINQTTVHSQAENCARAGVTERKLEPGRSESLYNPLSS